MITVRSMVVYVAEWVDRFRRQAPRTEIEAAIFDAIRFVYYRFIRQGGVHGVA